VLVSKESGDVILIHLCILFILLQNDKFCSSARERFGQTFHIGFAKTTCESMSLFPKHGRMFQAKDSKTGICLTIISGMHWTEHLHECKKCIVSLSLTLGSFQHSTTCLLITNDGALCDIHAPMISHSSHVVVSAVSTNVGIILIIDCWLATASKWHCGTLHTIAVPLANIMAVLQHPWQSVCPLDKNNNCWSRHCLPLHQIVSNVLIKFCLGSSTSWSFLTQIECLVAASQTSTCWWQRNCQWVTHPTMCSRTCKLVCNGLSGPFIAKASRWFLAPGRLFDHVPQSSWNAWTLGSWHHADSTRGLNSEWHASLLPLLQLQMPSW